MRSWLGALALMSIVSAVPAMAAERIKIRLGDPLPRFEKLRPGKHAYLRYRLSKEGTPSPMDVQTKEVRFEDQDGKRRLHIAQRWEGANSSLRLDSWFEDKTFRPLTHQRDLHQDGKVRREGFRFLPGKVVGIADQADNVRKDFEVADRFETFNFETDLEMLRTLPLRRGAEFEIIFYHPGSGEPAPYLFKVAGEEKVDFGGSPVECWVVTTDYNRPEGGITRFWVAKNSQIVIRVHSPRADGSATIKALLPGAG